MHVQAQEFAKVLVPLCKQLARCLNSSHFQVGAFLGSSCSQPALSAFLRESINIQQLCVFCALHDIVVALADSAMRHAFLLWGLTSGLGCPLSAD